MKKAYFVFTILLLIAITRIYAFEPCPNCNCEICECVELQQQFQNVEQQLQNVEQQLQQITEQIQGLEDEEFLEAEAEKQRRNLLQHRQILEMERIRLKLIQKHAE